MFLHHSLPLVLCSRIFSSIRIWGEDKQNTPLLLTLLSDTLTHLPIPQKPTFFSKVETKKECKSIPYPIALLGLKSKEKKGNNCMKSMVRNIFISFPSHWILPMCPDTEQALSSLLCFSQLPTASSPPVKEMGSQRSRGTDALPWARHKIASFQIYFWTLSFTLKEIRCPLRCPQQLIDNWFGQ